MAGLDATPKTVGTQWKTTSSYFTGTDCNTFADKLVGIGDSPVASYVRSRLRLDMLQIGEATFPVTLQSRG